MVSGEYLRGDLMKHLTENCKLNKASTRAEIKRRGGVIPLSIMLALTIWGMIIVYVNYLLWN